MAIIKGIALCTGAGNGFAKFNANGKSVVLNFSEQVKRYYTKLEDNKEYNIEYDDETDIALYIKPVDNTKSVTSFNENKPAPSNVTLSDKEKKEKGYVLLQGKWYATYKVLLDTAHSLYHNNFSVQTEIIEIDKDKKFALVQAIVNIRTATGIQTFSSYGDADPSNLASNMQSAYIRMADTRAVCRALRLATNIADTSLEEMPNIKEDDN